MVIQYADDVLVAGRHSGSVQQQALRTKADLERAGWVVSPKSSLDPINRVKWMGKVVGGDQGGVQNAPALQAHLICCWLRLATTGYTETTVGSAAREGGASIFGWCLPLAQPGTQHRKVYPNLRYREAFWKALPVHWSHGCPTALWGPPKPFIATRPDRARIILLACGEIPWGCV